jgi:hypothetical protein
MNLVNDAGDTLHCPRCRGGDWAAPPAGAVLHACTGCGAAVARAEMLPRGEVVLPWPGDCPNRAVDRDGEIRCCPGDDWGACDDIGSCGPAHARPCHADRGDWGAWRSIYAELLRVVGITGEWCEDGDPVAPLTALLVCGEDARAVGWYPWP